MGHESHPVPQFARLRFSPSRAVLIEGRAAGTRMAVKPDKRRCATGNGVLEVHVNAADLPVRAVIRDGAICPVHEARVSVVESVFAGRRDVLIVIGVRVKRAGEVPIIEGILHRISGHSTTHIPAAADVYAASVRRVGAYHHGRPECGQCRYFKFSSFHCISVWIVGLVFCLFLSMAIPAATMLAARMPKSRNPPSRSCRFVSHRPATWRTLCRRSR